ncbi:MAG: caspase family protein [Parachlamydiaceae bacterium]|nr:caspase family protein [Parachlamydiaceae bacterium]
MNEFLCKVSLLAYLFCSCIGSLNAAELHAILVGDVFSADIQQACHIDLKNMQTEMQKIAKNGHYKLQLKVLAGKNSSSREVLRVVKNLKPEKNDAIIFYFSGHGYRTENNGESPWPNFEFPLERVGLGMKDVIDIIGNKGATLAIIIADCCNIKIPQAYAPDLVMSKAIARIPVRKIKTNYQNLFCKTQGVIAIVSARNGQPSYCNSFGSFYTRSFLASLKSAVESRKAEWAAVFDQADDKLQTVLNVHQVHQDPIVFTNIK